MTSSTYPTLQDFIWADSITLIKATTGFQHYDRFYAYMLDNLPQNSPETRSRYAGLIQRRYFPERSLAGLIPTVWRSYQDEKILTDVMRLTALEGEPVVAQFVLKHILPQPPGTILNLELAKAFIKEIYGEFKLNSYKRLLQSCRDLGWLGRYNGDLLIERIAPPANAFLILLHARLAPTPRIVRFGEIMEANWRLLLGLPDIDTLRHTLRRAEIAGLLARFARVDELEQITTRYSREEYLGQAMRLSGEA
jgi:hypothetical protein